MAVIWFILGGLILLWILVQSAKAGSQKSKRDHAAPRAPSYERPDAASAHYAPVGEPQSRNAEAGRWIPAGGTVKIAGLSIDTGMIYVGGRLAKQAGQGVENCLIDPTLHVAGGSPDTLGETMSYWPAYGAIHPRARLAYLQWLADGRKDPSVGVGYVFLFFYGLKRRVFIDQATDDYAAIAMEVRRLLSLYGANHSFNSYARQFLALLDVFQDRGKTRPELTPDVRNGFELPLNVRFYLGLKLKEGEALSAEDALLWVMCMPDTFPRTPVVRCFDELTSLWALKFAEKWPSGVGVRKPQASLKLTYRAASGTFNGSFEADGLPDIATVHAPLTGLRDLLNACASELDSYSRLIGKRPATRGTLEAVTLLPKALRASDHGACAVAARARVLDLLGDEAVIVTPAPRVLDTLGLEHIDGLQLLGPVLDYLDIGFEPDRRYGGLAALDGDYIAIYRADDHRLPHDLDEFKAARTLVEIAMLAATADGVVDPTEIDVVNEEIRALPDLTDAERLRLLAYVLALAKAPPKPQRVFNRAGKLDATKRDALVHAATAAVLADGRVAPEEVKYLERLYKALGLPAEAVYAALHRGAGGNDEPVTVATAQIEPGLSIPRAGSARQASVAIDTDRLSKVREQTAAVSVLLSEIFIEETPSKATPSSAKSAEAQQGFPGLDACHSELLSEVLRHQSWSWPEFEAKARTLKLMPEGALETINDWAFDRFDEPLLEPGDPIAAAEHLRPQIQELETAA
jgi:tellurite resistance protein